MPVGNGVLFLKWTTIVSPTSAWIAGPRKPRWRHSDATGTRFLNVSSVYWR